MYLRFQGRLPNLGTASKLGIFQLAFELRDGEETLDYTFKELQQHLNWLKANLKSPEILDEDGHHRAISWFKPATEEHIDRMWAIKAILEEFGYFIDVLKSDDPGNVIYEDGWQLVAKPHRR